MADPHLIDGATRLLAIVGDPIVQVRSPQTLNPLIRAAGRNAVLVPMQVAAADFKATMRGLMRLGNLDGIVVTYPHKERAVGLADRVAVRAERVGAVNTLRREADGGWTGEMFDGVGFARAVAEAGGRLAGARILLLGAGGAGRAIGLEVAALGAAALTIADLDATRAEWLCARIARYFPHCAATPGSGPAAAHDVVVNATPVGLGPADGLPAPLDDLRPGTLVVDIVTRPATPLQAHAEARGCPVVRGPAMVAGQGRAMLEFFGLA